MKLAFSSDNHFDVNRLDVADIIPRQAEYLVEQGVAIYVIAGDLFNNFEDSLDYCRRLQEAVGNRLLVRFIAGNHDMGAGVSYTELESDLDPLYFHNKYLDVGDTIRLIGNNGWYDYGFDQGKHSQEEIAHFKHQFWYDRRIEQPMADPARFAINLAQIQKRIESAGNRRIILVDHFVPRMEFVQDLKSRHHRLDILKSFLGSPVLGTIADQANAFATISGHLHLHPSPLTVGNTTHYNVAVGYHTSRINEWAGDDFYTEWQKRLLILDV